MRALVTGAAHRLGQALAVELAEAGHDVAVHHHGTPPDETVALVEAAGRRAVGLRANLTSEEETAGLFPEALDALGGPITVLVNNASLFERDDIGSMTEDSWHRAISTNLRAPVLLTQAFAAQGLEAGEEEGEPIATGLIVNMLDQRVLKLTPDFVSYTLAKSALWTFTRTMSQALAPAIRVNGIGPGPTLKAARQSQAHFDAQRERVILQRGANPSDIRAALRYLLTARTVTGQIICTDGGQHLGWLTPDIIGEPPG